MLFRGILFYYFLGQVKDLKCDWRGFGVASVWYNCFLISPTFLVSSYWILVSSLSYLVRQEHDYGKKLYFHSGKMDKKTQNGWEVQFDSAPRTLP